jgi:hypothetical protein
MASDCPSDCPPEVFAALKKFDNKWRMFYASFLAGTYPVSHLVLFGCELEELVSELRETFESDDY